MDALLDTSILIDVSRGHLAALHWVEQHQETIFGLPVLVCMEYVDGVRDAQERRQALRLISQYPIVPLTENDSIWAQQQHAEFKLSHSVGIIDALIASPAARLAVPIYTLNIKHFAPLPGVTTFKPY
jgi:hypothetical protein